MSGDWGVFWSGTEGGGTKKFLVWNWGVFGVDLRVVWNWGVFDVELRGVWNWGVCWNERFSVWNWGIFGAEKECLFAWNWCVELKGVWNWVVLVSYLSFQSLFRFIIFGIELCVGISRGKYDFRSNLGVARSFLSIHLDQADENRIMSAKVARPVRFLNKKSFLNWAKNHQLKKPFRVNR